MIAEKTIQWMILLGSLWLAACSTTSPAVYYYTLDPLPPRTEKIAALPATTIGVGPIALPDYVDRPQMVMRTGPNQMRVNEYHRWAGELSNQITRIIARNLMILLDSHQIMPIPWPGDFNPDVIVRMEVYAFEGAADGTVRLQAAVTLTPPQGGSPPRVWSVDLTEKAAGATPLTITAAQSRLLAALSREIAERIVEMAK